MKLKSFLFALAGAGLLAVTGCASDPSSVATSASLRTVRLDQNFDFPPAMRYGVKGGEDDLNSTLSTEMINDVGEHSLRRMNAVMIRYNINVPEMIHNRVEKQLRQHPGLTFNDQSADGVFTVKVVQYGFDNPHLSLNHQFPFVLLSIELRDNKGHLVWTRKTSWTAPADDDLGADWDEYESHPQELHDAWAAQINQAVEKLISNPK